MNIDRFRIEINYQRINGTWFYIVFAWNYWNNFLEIKAEATTIQTAFKLLEEQIMLKGGDSQNET